MVRKTISMPDKMGDWIAGRINRAQYNNESEYFRDLVRRDQEEEMRKTYLLKRIERGAEQLGNGAFREFRSSDDIDALFDALKKVR